MKYILLGQEKKERIRTIARKHYLRHGDTANGNLAIEHTKQEIREKFKNDKPVRGIIASILIGLAIRLAIELILYWIKNRVMMPSIIYQEGEPQ